MLMRTFVALVATLLGTSPALGAGHDGVLFDQGAALDAPSDRASGETARLAFLVGNWDVETTWYGAEGESRVVDAHAATTFMNRGHGYLERFACPDFDGDGHTRQTVVFLVHAPTRGVWSLGMADSWSRSITLYSGGFTEEGFVVDAIDRRVGTGPLVHRRITIEGDDENGWTMVAASGEWGGELEPVFRRDYHRREDVPADLVGEGYGEAAPGLTEEAHQFDFLLGEWDLAHEMHFPDGRVAQWPARGTAIRILGGWAILEHTWYDVDPQVPDAATTILRIYNPVMRRWESMYTTNRFNNILYFGGVEEGDRIVLHSFENDLAANQFSYWIFHDMQADRYGWFADTSRDRGQTFEKTWIIEGTRRAP